MVSRYRIAACASRATPRRHSSVRAAKPPCCLSVLSRVSSVSCTRRLGAEGRMPAAELVTLGASAGGVEALSRVVAGLPVDFPAAVAVVLHLPPTAPSLLP